MSLGQFHYETEGFRENNDQTTDIYTAFVQTALTARDSLQAEYRYKDSHWGDIRLRFHMDDYNPDLRQPLQSDSLRLGYHHSFNPGMDLLASFVSQKLDISSKKSDTELAYEQKSNQFELQQYYRSKKLNLIGGAGYLNIDDEDTVKATYIMPPDPPIVTSYTEAFSVEHATLYLYSQLQWPNTVTWTVGGSYDRLKDEILDLDRSAFNPKLGVTWNPWPLTTVRAASFRTLRRYLINDQTLEPTQVAGFNQFFDKDGNGTESWLYGIAVDQKINDALFFGVELSRRNQEIPYLDYLENSDAPVNKEVDWKERFVRTYLYLIPNSSITATAELMYEKFEREDAFVGDEYFAELTTYKIPLGLNLFLSSGISLKFKATYLDQSGSFGDPFLAPPERDSDHGWIFDVVLKYRFPKDVGIIAVEVKNLFDNDLCFQDTDPSNPSFYPEFSILSKITLSF